MSNSACKYGECDRAIAPADGEYCGMHSKKLMTPHSAKITHEQLSTPKSAQVAKTGINTSSDFANFMGALMGDLVEGRVLPEVADAAVRVGDSLLRMVEMRLKHGFKQEAIELSEETNGIVSPKHLKLNDSKTTKQ